MDTSFLLSCFLSVLLSAGVLADSSTEPNEFVVSSVVRVHSANTFLCRFGSYAIAPGAVFRVHIPSVVIAQDPNTFLKAAFFVSKLLSSAESIVVCDIRARSYFGLQGRVLVDGKDLTGLLIEKNLTKPSPASQEWPAAYLREHSVESAPSSADSPLLPDVSRPVILPLSAMLNRKVNLSRITPQTTLKEAIEYLAGSQEPAVPVMVLWEDLQINCLLGPETPVGTDGLTEVSVLAALKYILRSASAGGPLPVIRIEKNLLTIGSEKTFPGKSSTGVYPIEELVGSSPYSDRL